LARPIFYLTASAIVPPASLIPRTPKCKALVVAELGTYRSFAENFGLS